MSGGMIVNRSCILVMPDGHTVVDWGDGRAQDLDTGNFFELSSDMTCYSVSEDDLAFLVKTGRILKYDHLNVHLASLPDDNTLKTID